MMHTGKVSNEKLIFGAIVFVLFVLSYYLPDEDIAKTSKTVPSGAFLTSLLESFGGPNIVIRIVCVVVVALPVHMSVGFMLRLFRPSGDGHLNPPSAIVRETLGRLLYFAAVKRRKTFTENQSLGRPAIDFGLPIVDLGYSSISTEELHSKNFVVISGPPGVGKSIHMAEQIRQRVGDFDLVMRLYPSEIGCHSEERAGSPIWQGLLRAIGIQPDHEARLRQIVKRDVWLFAYMLAHRPVLIIVEDLHLTQKTTAAALLSIQEYFQQFHRWGQHVSVVCTTRDTKKMNPFDPLDRETSVIELEPMEQRPAQTLFWKLSRALDVAENELQAEGALLGRAFDTLALRVPLFISICAYLIAPRHRQPLPIARVLAMTAARLLEAFVTKLCERALIRADAAVEDSGAAVNEFHSIVAELAHEFWLISDNVKRDDLDEALLKSRANRCHQFDVDFLVNSGLFVRESLTSNKLGFPHEAISDYLTACHMVASRDFQKLEMCRNPSRLESIRDILTDLVETAEVLERLLYSDPTTAVAIFGSSRYRRHGEMPDPQQVGEDMARWAMGGAPYSLEETVWEKVRQVFEDLYGGTWLREMTEQVGKKDESTEEDIRLLIGVGYAETLAIIEGWLAEGGRDRSFELAAANRDVRKKLYEIVTTKGVRDVTGRAAFGVLWRRASQYGSLDRDREPIEEVVEYLEEVWKNPDENELRTLYSNFGENILGWIGLLARDASIDEKRGLSEICAKAFGRVLVCAGKYREKEGGKPAEEIKISRPLWVPCVAEPSRDFLDHGSAETALREYEQDLMSVDEVTVVLRHFEYQEERHGGAVFEYPCEAFRSSIGGVKIFYLSPQGYNPVTTAHPPEGPITVRFRRVVRL